MNKTFFSVLAVLLVIFIIAIVDGNPQFAMQIRDAGNGGGASRTIDQSDMVLYLPFNGNMLDYSGNNYDASCLSGSCPSPAPSYDQSFNGAYFFDGIDDFITIPNNNDLDLNGDFSILLWIKFDNFINGENVSVISKEHWNSNTVNSGYTLEKYDLNDVYFINYANSHPIQNNVKFLAEDDWQHVAITYDASDMLLTVYKNGVEIDSNSNAVNVLGNTNNLYIGANTAPDRFFKGTLDELIIYSKVLTSNEIEDYYFENVDNLINNPSYEIDLGIDFDLTWDLDDVFSSNLIPDGWTASYVGGPIIKMDSANSRTGKYSVMLRDENDNAFLGQDVPVKYGETYKLSGYVKVDPVCRNSECYGSMGVHCVNINHTIEDNMWNCPFDIVYDWTKVNNLGWTYVEYQTTINREDISYLSILCYKMGENSDGSGDDIAGTVWCDDLMIEKIVEKSTSIKRYNTYIAKLQS
ncbi:hypothetical protein HN865_03700 [Candidatus Woesearchaeota archaeon]|nr:hypothetical protein [Candidatus Woesearchaeota archaeon]MBT7237936.1 hypothetical protein [Candidatus Woesearchaeota archaeon]